MSSLDGMTCPLCHKGIFEQRTIVEKVKLSHGRYVSVPNVTVDQCTHCKETCTDGKNYRKVERAIERKYPGYFRKTGETTAQFEARQKALL